MRVLNPPFTPSLTFAAVFFAMSAGVPLAHAQKPGTDVETLSQITVQASADASADGLAPAYEGGQVATGARIGILGSRDYMETPFSFTSYTNELIEDRHAHSVGDVLQNDPGVRVARGFGNFQEAYFIRGFLLGSDDVSYNGLYGLLPRQYISAEIFERVDVLRGASAFLTGATPGGGGIGGIINLVPKRAPTEPLTRLSAGWTSKGTIESSADVARRFGDEQQFGVRVSAGQRGGESSIDREHNSTGVVSLGLDWQADRFRLSADLGWQENRLKRTRTNVTVDGLTEIPDAPDASSNFAQDWSYSNERDLFGSLRGEFDVSDNVTAWAAYGMRRSKEANSLANVRLTDGGTGDGNIYRFDNTRRDRVKTGEVGLRGKLQTGPVKHEVVVAASYFDAEKDNAYAMDYTNTFPTNIYAPRYYARPAFSADTLFGNDLDDPALQGRTRLTSFSIGDTLSFLDDRLLLTLGVRHQTINVRSYAYDTGAESDRYKQSRNSPAAGLVVKLTPDISAYANYIESLAQGETAPTTQGGLPVANAGEMLSPYVSKQKEIGLKYDGGGLGGGLAFFSTDKPRAYVGDDRRFSAAGKDRHQGIELTMFGELTPSMRVLGGVTWLDAKQRDTGAAATDGKRVIGVPRLQANLGLEWDIPGVEGLAVDGRVVYTGSSYADSENTLKVPGWTRLDAGLRYRTEISGKSVTWRARVDNITNRDYWASVGGYPGNGYLVLGAPRTYSLTASIEF
ncbi:TonB-dependent receptor [Allopusillimonas ginsengisoli]|uniref:TonB-dependent receptor n=1 Tax=Allopusillimonas ginsengisoli TaxID=453575 RepID=UPI00101EF23A|nr:TonB-dependent receptor [Allopusillimonas ginsengisoli]